MDSRRARRAPGTIQNSSLDISTTLNRRQFKATLALADGSVRVLCDGSVSQADTMDLQGSSAAGGVKLAGHGKISVFGDGSVRLVTLQYQLNVRRGSLMDQGYLLLIQRAGGLNWADIAVPAVQRNWNGIWSSGFTNGGSGPADLLLPAVQKGSAFAASLQFDTVDATGLSNTVFSGDGQGTVTVPAVQDGSSHTLIIAADGDNGSVAILIGLLLPAVRTNDVASTSSQLVGSYRLYHGLQAVFGNGRKAVGAGFNDGAYSLVPAVQ